MKYQPDKNTREFRVFAELMCTLICIAFCPSVSADDITFWGDCDASTAIAISRDSFFVIGDEKKPKARLYYTTGGSLPEAALKGMLSHGTEKKEPDLEASALVKETVFVIGSHGRNDKGILCPERNQLLAFKYKMKDDNLKLSQVGSCYSDLHKHLLKDHKFQQFALDSDPENDNDDLVPKEGKSMNVEGLAVARNGEDLLIGLRSPLFQSKAILIPLKNPIKLVKEEDGKPTFGDAILLDLNNQGIRSIEYWPENDCYLVVSGNFGNKRGFQVFTWNGSDDKPVRILDALDEELFNPEAIVVFPSENSKFLLLSDDGTRVFEGEEEECKHTEKSRRHFSGRWIKLN